jgi:hypothetical protein
VQRLVEQRLSALEEVEPSADDERGDVVPADAVDGGAISVEGPVVGGAAAARGIDDLAALEGECAAGVLDQDVRALKLAVTSPSQVGMNDAFTAPPPNVTSRYASAIGTIGKAAFTPGGCSSEVRIWLMAP